MFGELVLGLGETLLGNYPGRALSFTVPHWTAGGEMLPGMPVVLAFPSKRVGIFVPGGGVMVRSDSTGEDVAGFSGAGLYDSVVCGRGVEERPLVRPAAVSALLFSYPFIRNIDSVKDLSSVGCGLGVEARPSSFPSPPIAPHSITAFCPRSCALAVSLPGLHRRPSDPRRHLPAGGADEAGACRNNDRGGLRRAAAGHRGRGGGRRRVGVRGADAAAGPIADGQ